MSQKLLLLVFILVLAKTIFPEMPIYVRYYVYLLVFYMQQLYQAVSKHCNQRTIHRTLKTVLQRLLQFISKKPAISTKPWSMWPLPSRDSQNPNWKELGDIITDICVSLRQQAVSRFPEIIHTTSHRLHVLHDSGRALIDFTRGQIPFHDYILTAMATVFVIYAKRRCFKRIRNAAEVPLEWYKQKRKLHGYCVAVSDSDNIRFYHTPTPLHRPPKFKAGGLKISTINVRLAGIDAPEMGHFGGTPQPFSQEAKDWLAKTMVGHRCTVELLRLDQYNRVVGSVKYWPSQGWLSTLFFWCPPRSLSLDMLKAGLATMYLGAGAEYGGLEGRMKEAEKKAKSRKVGMWACGDAFVSPALYKKQALFAQVQAQIQQHQQSVP